MTLGSDAEGAHAAASRSESDGPRMRRRRGDESRERVETLIRFAMAWWLRGIAAAPHVAGSCQGIASLKARAERSPRGEREAASIETPPPLSPRGFDVPTSGPARGSAQAGPTNRVLRTPSEYTQSLIVCRSRYRSVGRVPLRIREALGALWPRPRATTCGKTKGTPKSVPWSRCTP